MAKKYRGQGAINILVEREIYRGCENCLPNKVGFEEDHVANGCAANWYISVPEPVKETRHELYKRVDADYYGYRDEDDGILLEYEAKQERRRK